jgi:hypothetical protein
VTAWCSILTQFGTPSYDTNLQRFNSAASCHGKPRSVLAWCDCRTKNVPFCEAGAMNSNEHNERAFKQYKELGYANLHSPTNKMVIFMVRLTERNADGSLSRFSAKLGPFETVMNHFCLRRGKAKIFMEISADYTDHISCRHW